MDETAAGATGGEETDGAARERPGIREKLAQEGPSRLTDVELVALLLGTGIRGRPVLALAREVLDAGGGLAGLAARFERAGPPPRGLGPVAASRLQAAFEIARRLGPDPRRPPIRQPEDVAHAVRDIVAEPREHLVGLYLDARATLIARETVAVGSLNVARATPRDFLEPALRLLASGFVMAHNHPSGVAEPSDDDVLFTRSVARAANLMGIPLYDHVIVARGGHASLRARGIRWDGQDAR